MNHRHESSQNSQAEILPVTNPFSKTFATKYLLLSEIKNPVQHNDICFKCKQIELRLRSHF